jgi:hypothetical protein
MTKDLLWTGQAQADIRAIDQQPALQVLKTIARFLKGGEGDTSQLCGAAPVPSPRSGLPRLLPRQ